MWCCRPIEPDDARTGFRLSLLCFQEATPRRPHEAACRSDTRLHFRWLTRSSRRRPDPKARALESGEKTLVSTGPVVPGPLNGQRSGVRGEARDYRLRAPECKHPSHTCKAPGQSGAQLPRRRLDRIDGQTGPLPLAVLQDPSVELGAGELPVVGDRDPVDLDRAVLDRRAPRPGSRSAGRAARATARAAGARRRGRPTARASPSGAAWSLNTRSNSASAASPAPGPWYRSTTVAAEQALCGVRVQIAGNERTEHLGDPLGRPVGGVLEVGGHRLRRESTSACRTARPAPRRSRRSCRATSTSSARRRGPRATAW